MIKNVEKKEFGIVWRDDQMWNIVEKGKKR